jgi:hypothetical protein
VSETDLASVTAGLLREGTSQPARACEAFKYQPCRLTIASLVLRKAAEFSTHPAFEACSKLNAGRVKEGPGQMAQIHAAGIYGPMMMVNLGPKGRSDQAESLRAQRDEAVYPSVSDHGRRPRIRASQELTLY